VVDGARLIGVVDRQQLEAVHSPDTPARVLARRERVTIGGNQTVADAIALMDETGGRRLVVVADDGSTVQGLLCLSSDRTGFCG
jgi:CBS domain-containing protein